MRRMSAAQKKWHKILVQKVHLTKKYRSYYKDDREAYEQMLYGAFGKRSSKDLSIDELGVLIDWLNDRIDQLPVHHPDRISQAQVTLLRALWGRYARDGSDTALLAFVKRVSGKVYLKVERIEKEAAVKAISALKKTLGE